MEKLRNLRLTAQDLKESAKRAQAVHNCPVCQAHLDAIKEHEKRGHPV